MYNSYEERALIEDVSQRRGPGVVVGVGSDIPERTQPWRFRKKFNVRRPFALYVGRIDENKGCTRAVLALRALRGDASARPRPGADRVERSCRFPKHPRIRHLGFLPDEDKFDALAAADVLVMPSPYESLSMVALEAWALGKPVLANGAVRRAARPVHAQQRAGSSTNVEEFAEALYLLEATGPLGARARPARPRVLPAPLHVAGNRAEVPRMFDRLKREPAPRDRTAARIVRATPRVERAGGTMIVAAAPSGAGAVR